jgi:serine/threonine protein kinase
MTHREDRKILRDGKLLGDFSIVRLLGQGGFGDIYEVVHTGTHTHYAMKLEQVSMHKQALRREVGIMRVLNSPHFPALVDYSETVKYRYLVMELCGPSFSTIRRLIPRRKFSISTVIRSGIAMLQAIEACHRSGVLHRDIKPSNFLIRASRKFPVALIDYGLGRIYVDARSGAAIPPRQRPGFVGTAKYASLNAHAGRELGRRDDLFSWFYCLVEMWAGRLPWATTRDRQAMVALKCATDIMAEIRDLPFAMRNVYRLIRRLEFSEEPDYRLMTSFMVQAMEECGADWSDAYEWERMDLEDVSAIPLIPREDDERDSFGELPRPVLPPRPLLGGRDPDEKPERGKPARPASTDIMRRPMAIPLCEELPRRDTR